MTHCAVVRRNTATAIQAHLDCGVVGGVVPDGHALQNWQGVYIQLVGFCGTGSLHSRNMTHLSSITSAASICKFAS